ncbi:MAG: hypothetical protein EOP43_03550 [Sphingobacteriaceae bacterium]|nr:MAG: hypothetical protein EOP43_03550 [Sphingobacteriaceae bacterium]
MKKLLFVVLLSAGTVAQAQQKTETTDASKSCWVVESNVKTPQKQVVKFYDSNQQLIYQEAYDQKILNYSRKNIRKMLDSALFTVIKTKNNSDTMPNLVNVIKRKY